MKVNFFTADERKAWFETKFTIETLGVLQDLYKFNLKSRQLLVHGLHNAIYRPVSDKTGDFVKLPEPQRRLLMDMLTLEMLSHVMHAIEDLGKIFIALRKPIPDMPGALIGANQKDSLQAYSEVLAASDQKLAGMLDLWDPARYEIDGDAAVALREYYALTMDGIRKLCRLCEEFIAFHDFAYNKYKHGNAITMGLQGNAPAPGFDAPIGIHTDAQDTTKSKFVLSGERVVQQMRVLVNAVTGLSEALVGRRMQLSETGGVPVPLLAVFEVQNDQIGYSAYFMKGVTEELRGRLRPLWEEFVAQRERMAMTLNIEVNVEPGALQERLAFYQRDWFPE
jgi:hypothetical protein